MNNLHRRGWGIFVGTGALALTAGAWWRTRQPEDGNAVDPAGSGHAPSTAGGTARPSSADTGRTAESSPLPEAVTTLDGRTLTAAGNAGRAVILNFWAPWCPPCVREMPELDRFARSEAGRGVLVLGLAIDERPAVEKFLAAHPVSFPIAVLGFGGLARVRQLSQDGQAALPFSAVFDRRHHLLQRKFGPTNAAELSGWIQGA